MLVKLIELEIYEDVGNPDSVVPFPVSIKKGITIFIIIYWLKEKSCIKYQFIIIVCPECY